MKGRIFFVSCDVGMCCVLFLKTSMAVSNALKYVACLAQK